VLLQLPWAVRVYEEAAEVLGAARPSVVCLYNESGGLGRAVIAAARAAGVPSVAVQHGILYPRYYSYTYTAAETDAPRPDRTAVFGTAARRELVSQGHYEPQSLVLTGSPKFDQLLAAAQTWDRAAVRARLGVSERARLVLVASRFRGIRATHQCIASAFPAFVRAIEALPDVVAVVKPHPAEPARPYEEVITASGTGRVRVLAPQTPLLDLLHAADLVVTVESLSAVEALVLNRPLIILNTPTNLQEMVEAGVAIGVPEGEDPGPALRAALFDPAAAARFQAARSAYLPDVAFGMDGQATRRIVELIEKTALGAPVIALETS
jgi:UDP-N-acetylglucosamine 2-epimerase